MRRDTLAFTIAGVVFGFVLGYMAAGWQSSMPRPVPVGAAASAPEAGSPEAGAAATGAGRGLDCQPAAM